MKRISVRNLLTLGLLFFASALLCRTAGANCTAYNYNATADSIVSQANTGNAYYIDYSSGSDTNDGLTTSTPWKHHPFMRGAAVKGYSHHAGDCFYFKGGVTWPNSALQVSLTSGGTSGNEDYYGPDPDQSWFAGSSWTRPRLDIGAAPVYVPNSTTATGNIWNYLASNIIVDSFEIVNAIASDSVGQQTIFSPNIADGTYWIRNYIHSFQPVITQTRGVFIYVWAAAGTATATHGIVGYNVVDGADGNKGYITDVVRSAIRVPVVHNVFHDVCSAVNSSVPVVAYNLIYNVGPWQSAPSTPGSYNVSCTNSPWNEHPDVVQTDTNTDVHDNVFHHGTGEVTNFVPQPGTVSHIYNNVMYANTPVNIMSSAGAGGIAIYNNTLECESIQRGNPCIIIGPSGSTSGPVTIYNNHNITATGTSGICMRNAPISNSGCGGASTLTYAASTELYQSLSDATAAGYSLSSTAPYSPTSSSSPTVKVSSLNLSTNCTSLVLLCMDSSAGSVVVSNNTAMPGRTQNQRPLTGSWQAGAYQFGGSSTTSTVQPPTGLSATVN
jgi:hypothetical protein